jgi:hypothetical protein
MTEHLVDEGIEPSVGSVDDAYDNALAETQQWVDWPTTERPHEQLDVLTRPKPSRCTTICEP